MSDVSSSTAIRKLGDGRGNPSFEVKPRMQFLRDRQQNAPIGTPKIVGAAGFAWLFPEREGSSMQGYLLEVPWYSPRWMYWVISIIRTEELEDRPVDPGTTHEILCVPLVMGHPLPTMDDFADAEGDLFDAPGSFMHLMVPDDKTAHDVLAYLVTHTCEGLLSPCIEHAHQWAHLTDERVKMAATKAN